MIQKSGILRRYRAWFALGQRLLDTMVVFSLMPALCALWAIPFSHQYRIVAVLGALLTWAAMDAVDAHSLWRGTSFLREIQMIIGAWLLVISALLLLAWGLKVTGTYSRLVMVAWFVLSPLALGLIHIAERACLRVLRRRGRNIRTAAIVGAGNLGRELAKRILDADWMGIRIIGFFDDDARKLARGVFGLPVLGRFKDVYGYVRDHSIDHVYLALPMHLEEHMREVFDALQDTTASVFLVPDLFIFELMGARELDIAGLPAFALCETPLTGPFGVLKRLEDVLLASLILVFVFPLMVVIALGVKLSSPGPVLFKQRRYGLNGKEVRVWKFRTMTVCEDGDCVTQARPHDPRVTRFGAFLRRTSLDELPQFINVLQGHMSVVGPRPHSVAHNEYYRKLIKGYMWRHKVKPGITGWAQVNGWRGETERLEKMVKRVQFDLDYIRNWSLWLDLKIVWLTILRGFTGKNVY